MLAIFNFGNSLSESSVRTIKNMTHSQKRDWALVKRVSSLIVRSQIVREVDENVASSTYRYGKLVTRPARQTVS